MAVDPTATVPSHHISLEETDGSNKYGLVLCDSQGDADMRRITKLPIRRMPLKMQQGDSEWSDFELPYQNVAQDDWSGGRGKLDDDDFSRYWHGFMVNTMHMNKAFLGPLPSITTGYRNMDSYLLGNMSFTALYGGNRYVERQFDASASYNTDKCDVWLKKVGSPTGNVTLELCADSGGDPDTVHKTITLAASSIGTLLSQRHTLDWTTTQAVVSGTTYHIKVYGDAAWDADDHVLVGVDTDNTTDSQKSSDGSSWSTADNALYFRVTDADADAIHHFFEYMEQLYYVTNPDAGGAPKLYINGDRGVGTGASSSTTLEDTSKSWTNDQFIGAIVKITAGTGKGQWRAITDNDGNTLTVSPAWQTTPVANDSEYVVVATSWWTERGTTGLTAPVTDVLVSDKFVYFCQGDGVNIRRFREYNNAATWTIQYADDGTNEAHFMKKVWHEGKKKIWKARNSGVSEIARAAPASSWANLTFGTGIEIGDPDNRITGLDKYFDPEYLMVFFDGEAPYRVVGKDPQQMPLREMQFVKSENNGRASCVGGVYLYFSLMSGVERYYQGRLDDIGPNLDDGLQPGYQGPVYDMLSYPGRIYAAVAGEDWGTSSYSSVQVHNGFGWHSFYRSMGQGDKIRKIHHQVIPGSTLDRLWVSEGSDVVWLAMPSETLDPTQDSSYQYFHDGMLQLSHWDLNVKDINKTLNDINVWMENAVTTEQFVDGRYTLDRSGTNVDLSSAFGTSPVTSVEISTQTSQIQGKSVQFALFLHTTDKTKTPQIKAVVLEAVAHLPTKFRYSVQFRIDDKGIDLRDDEEFVSVATLSSQLDTWANSGTQLIMRHHATGPMNTKTVFISAPTYTPLSNTDDEDKASFLCTMEIYEA